MGELVVIILAGVIALLVWSRIAKGLDWTGMMIAKNGDSLQHLSTAGSLKASELVVSTHDSLQDKKHTSSNNAAKREKERKKFLQGLDTAQVKSVDKNTTDLDKLLAI